MTIKEKYNEKEANTYMKSHFFLQSSDQSIIDIDKKIPYVKALFPKSKIEKKPLIGDREFLIVRDIADDMKLISYNNATCEIPLRIDFFGTAFLGYAFLDIQLEITDEMAASFNFPNFLLKSKMLIAGEEQSVSNLMAKVLWPYYQS